MSKTILTGLAAAPVLAMFLGIGVLAMRIGDTWDQRNTDALVTALASICAGGSVVIGVLLALIVGVPLALRAYASGGQARRSWPEQPVAGQWRALPPGQQPTWAEQPPMLTDRQQGQWLSQGQQYDLWEEPAGEDWRQ